MANHRNELRRKQILQSAFECFSKFGYSKTSLDQIAQKAGISRPLIYLQFKDKEDLFTCMIEDILEKRYAIAKASLNSSLPKKQKLFNFVEILVLNDTPLFPNTFTSEEFFSEIFRILPEIEEKYRKIFIHLAASILGNTELAEVFRFSLAGLKSDNPPIETLKKRAEILINCFCT
ncbi:MAG: TetR/AcrR family transcriptional regulator [Proteobacteria bacterium]|nr:TetR/AcrR family transcriptional regulator [Pseudomonadota bacterium]